MNKVDFSDVQAKGVSLRHGIAIGCAMTNAVLDFSDLTGTSWHECSDLATITSIAAETTTSHNPSGVFHPNLAMGESIKSCPIHVPSWILEALFSQSARDTVWILFTTIVLALSISGIPSIQILTRRLVISATTCSKAESDSMSKGEVSQQMAVVGKEVQAEVKRDNKILTTCDVNIPSPLKKKYSKDLDSDIETTPMQTVPFAKETAIGKENPKHLMSPASDCSSASNVFVKTVETPSPMITPMTVLSENEIPATVKEDTHIEEEGNNNVFIGGQKPLNRRRKRVLDKSIHTHLPAPKLYR